MPRCPAYVTTARSWSAVQKPPCGVPSPWLSYGFRVSVRQLPTVCGRGCLVLGKRQPWSSVRCRCRCSTLYLCSASRSTNGRGRAAGGCGARRRASPRASRSGARRRPTPAGPSARRRSARPAARPAAAADAASARPSSAHAPGGSGAQGQVGRQPVGPVPLPHGGRTRDQGQQVGRHVATLVVIVGRSSEPAPPRHAPRGVLLGRGTPGDAPSSAWRCTHLDDADSDDLPKMTTGTRPARSRPEGDP